MKRIMKRAGILVLGMVLTLSALVFPAPEVCATSDCNNAEIACINQAAAEWDACVYLYSQDGSFTFAEYDKCEARTRKIHIACLSAWGC